MSNPCLGSTKSRCGVSVESVEGQGSWMSETGSAGGSDGMRRREFMRNAGTLAVGASGLLGLPSSAFARRSTVKRVAIFGGGPAGMTAAHELAERGFRVDLYERQAVLGGKVRSLTARGTGTDGRPDYPLNMGGHYFIGGYPNLGETLGRIPVGAGRTVGDNLDKSGRSLTLFAGKAAVTAPLPGTAGRLPNGTTPEFLLNAVTAALRPIPELTPKDVALIASKLGALLTSGEKRGWAQLEHIGFPDYLRTDLLSENAKAIGDLPGFLGVGNHNGMNTRAFERFLDVFINGAAGQTGPGLDQALAILPGPETKEWFDPWARYLASLGTRFHMRQTLAGLTCKNGRITGATVRDHRGRRSRVAADYYVLAVPQPKAKGLINRAMRRHDEAFDGISELQELRGMSMQILLNHRLPKMGDLFTSLTSPWQTGSEILTKMWDLNLEDYGDGKAKEYVSFQIADTGWTRDPGMLYGKPGSQCTGQEVINEVLAQLREHMDNATDSWAPSAIHSIRLAPGVSTDLSKPLKWDEWLFPASPSCWQYQPNQLTGIPNFFLAGSYTRAQVIGENMDAANESGKRAAAGILEASRVRASPVTLGTFKPLPALQALREADDRAYELGLPNALDVVAPLYPRR